MSYGRCSVVWTDDPFKDEEGAGRPWLVLNNDEHPFEDQQVMEDTG